jgi:hypothetical protein
MRASRSAVAAALVGIAMLAGATACGTAASGQSGKAAASTAPANPLAGLTADQIATRAVANLKAASSVHYAGSVNDSNATYTVNLTASTKNCTGTFGIVGKGSFVLLKIGQTLWIKPDNKFWTSEGATPEFLRLDGGSDGKLDFSDYNAPLRSIRRSPARRSTAPRSACDRLKPDRRAAASPCSGPCSAEPPSLHSFPAGTFSAGRGRAAKIARGWPRTGPSHRRHGHAPSGPVSVSVSSELLNLTIELTVTNTSHISAED